MLQESQTGLGDFVLLVHVVVKESSGDEEEDMFESSSH